MDVNDRSGVRVGLQTVPDGSIVVPRGTREAGILTANGPGFYEEMAYRKQLFHMTLAATTTGAAAGNLMAASAAQATNFALFNPPGSGKLLVLLKFGVAVISATLPVAPVFHGAIYGLPTVAVTGTIVSGYLGQSGSVARGWATAAGTTLTGGGAPSIVRMANFSHTAGTATALAETPAIEEMGGDIIVPEGWGWVPLWAAAGTSLLCAYSVTWREIPA